MSARPALAVPPPRLQQVHNPTPFPHLQFDKMGKGRRFHDVVIVCASFVLGAGRLRPAAAHRGPVFADEVWDSSRSELSSLCAATDVLLVKPAADVYVTGTARAPRGRACSAWEAALRVERGGEALIDKRLRLTGLRHWSMESELADRRPDEPAPAEAVALRYELAYGGWWYDRGDEAGAPPRIHASNPCGTGWFGTASRNDHPRARYRDDEAVPAPQIEYANAPVAGANQDLPPAGFGPIARAWEPRVSLAGTYDDAWRRRFEGEAVVDYAADFDERFFQYAPADQVIAPGLVGDESIHMAGFFPAWPTLEMQLPDIRLHAVCTSGSGDHAHEAMKLDTVHIDLDAERVHLTWRLTLDQARDIVSVSLRQHEEGAPK